MAGIWRQAGITVIDADQIVHLLLSQTGPTQTLVLSKFGHDLLLPDGSLDRSLLGQRVFADTQKLQQLEAILHPLVQQDVQKQKQTARNLGQSLAVYDVPLLFEKNLQSQFDAIVVVSCSREQQIQRLQVRNSWSLEQAQQRLAHQLPIAKKVEAATHVIDNSGSLEQLTKKTLAVLQILKK